MRRRTGCKRAEHVTEILLNTFIRVPHDLKHPSEKCWVVETDTATADLIPIKRDIVLRRNDIPNICLVFKIRNKLILHSRERIMRECPLTCSVDIVFSCLFKCREVNHPHEREKVRVVLVFADVWLV